MKPSAHQDDRLDALLGANSDANSAYASFADELAAAGTGEHPLSSQLRRDTQSLHEDVRQGAFIKAFIRGEVDRPLYSSVMRTMHVVYDALEEALASEARKGSALIRPTYFPELARAPSIAADLAVLAGADWTSRVAPLAVAEPYIARLREVAMTQPELLLAHAYVRYLGDLSGGQMMKKTARKVLGFAADDPSGTAFFEFPQVPDPRVFKEKYRAALDGLGLGAEQRAAVVREALRAYELNRAILLEADGLLSAQKRGGGALPAGHPPATGSGRCPFSAAARFRLGPKDPSSSFFWSWNWWTLLVLAIAVALAALPFASVGGPAHVREEARADLPPGHPPTAGKGGSCPFAHDRPAPAPAPAPRATSNCPVHLAYWTQRPALAAGVVSVLAIAIWALWRAVLPLPPKAAAR